MVTFGLVAQTDRAWHPEEPFSAEHWNDSFWSAFGWVSYGVSGYSAVGGTTVFSTNSLNLAKVSTHGYKPNYTEVGAPFNAETLKMTKTVASHTERSYLNSPLAVNEIMLAARPTIDKQVSTALKWNVPGKMLGSTKMISGIWELVIDTKGNKILHFLFNSKR